jgi:hypothetical protein
MSEFEHILPANESDDDIYPDELLEAREQEHKDLIDNMVNRPITTAQARHLDLFRKIFCRERNEESET